MKAAKLFTFLCSFPALLNLSLRPMSSVCLYFFSISLSIFVPSRTSHYDGRNEMSPLVVVIAVVVVVVAAVVVVVVAAVVVVVVSLNVAVFYCCCCYCHLHRAPNHRTLPFAFHLPLSITPPRRRRRRRYQFGKAHLLCASE